MMIPMGPIPDALLIPAEMKRGRRLGDRRVEDAEIVAGRPQHFAFMVPADQKIVALPEIEPRLEALAHVLQTRKLENQS